MGAAIPIIAGGWQLYANAILTPSPAERKAEQVISEFKQPPYATARVAVAQLPTDVLRELAPAESGGCGTDRTQWSQDCFEARSAFEDKLRTKMWDSPEARSQFTMVVKYYQEAMRCASTGGCDKETVDNFFEEDIQMFWRQTWPYARAAAAFDEYAKWLLTHCDAQGGAT